MPTKPMNLLILMSDEHTRRMTGCYGHPVVETPNLDRFAARGVRFDNAYVNNPICVPSRANFITGRYTHDTGNWDNSMPYSGAECQSFGHRLAEQGHQFTTVGKLHYRYLDDDNGLPDSRLAMNVVDGRGAYWLSMRWNIQPSEGYLDEVNNAGAGECSYTRFDRAVATETASWLKNEAATHDKPWCLLASFGSPHPPFQVPQEWLDMYPPGSVDMPINFKMQDWPDHPYWNETRPWRFPVDEDLPEDVISNAVATYYGLVSFLDDKLGRVLDALDKAGLTDSTRIIYTSDHGEMLGGHGLWGKMCMYEDSVAVPLIAAGPDLPAGVTCAENVSWVDIFPTVCDGLGAALANSDADLPGTSLWPIARGEESPGRPAFSEYHAAQSPTGNFMIKDERYKYVYYSGAQYPPQLFDLVVDPTERHDLGCDPAHEDTVARLDVELRKICDPDAVNDAAFADQHALIDKMGGDQAVIERGPTFHSTPPPSDFLGAGGQV